MKNTIILLGLVLLTSCKETSKEMEMEQVEEVPVQETTTADLAEKNH
jgi:hypothetical protein